MQVSAEVEDWRRDRIRVKVAKVHALLGHNEQSDRFEADVVESESGKVAAVEAMVAADDAFNDQMVAIDQLLALGSFDITRNALESSTELFNRFYQDPVRRSLVEEKIKASSGNLPLFIRIELLMTLAEFALAHSDQAGALELVNEAQQLFESAQWQLEHWMPRAAGLAELRFQAGDPEKARDDAKSALARYEADGEQIVNIYRAKALRPLAAAYQSMGDTAGALAIYKQAVEAGVVNPNSRPRAEDLSATCCSMAVEGVEPDAELRARVHQIREGLGRPW